MKATVLIVDDDDSLRRALGDRLEFWGHAVTQAGGGEEALAVVGTRSFDLILLDLAMPGVDGFGVLERLSADECDADVVVLTAHGSVEKAVEAMRLGAADFLPKPADFELLRRVIERTLEKRRLGRVNRAQAEQIGAESGIVVGPSPIMHELIETAERVAATDAGVLLTGESGTGKQVMAELIHRRSPRAKGPFVYVNCVAISDELIESTLFGHEKGAFTGAVARKEGRLEAAGAGTAFLDEVGDISPKLQTKLLHFLESGEFERVGGSRTLSVDCRIIGATNRDLKKEVEAERFREDLFYRLNVVALEIPPLRERPEDIPLLADHFLQRFGADLKREGLAFAAETRDVIANYAWPGNVRQLKNAVERMVVLAPSVDLTPDLLPPEVRTPGGDASGMHGLMQLPYKDAVSRFKAEMLRRALSRADGNQTRAAETLGIQRSYLNRLLHDLGLADSKW